MAVVLSQAKIRQELDGLGLYLNSPERCIICKSCGYALKTTGQRVSRHLDEKHGVPKSDRKRLTALIQSLKLGDPNKIFSRPDGSEQHEYLKVYVGYACRDCDNCRTTSADIFLRHLSKTHGWKGSRKRDGWHQDHVDSNVLLQSWVQNGARGFWIVQPKTSVLSRSLPSSLPSSQLPEPGQGQRRDLLSNATANQLARLATMHETERVHLAGQTSTISSGNVDLTLNTNWMRRTGWEEMFKGAHRDLLVLMSAPPFSVNQEYVISQAPHVASSGADEQRLGCCIDALDRLLDHCEDTLRYTDVSLRCWLRSQDSHRPFKAPFELVGRLSTTRNYRRLLKRFLCFCVRLWRLTPSARQSLFRRSLTIAQTKALMQFWSDEIWSDVLREHSNGKGNDRSGTIPSSNSRQPDDSEPDDVDGSGESDDEHDGEEKREEPYLDAVTDGTQDVEVVESETPHDHLHSSSVSLEANPTTNPAEALEDMILRLLYFLVTEEFEDGHSSSTLLVYFSGVLGISADGLTFQRPKDFTSKLSALVYYARLIVLEARLPRKPHYYIGWKARPCLGQLDRLNSVRKEKICLGSLAPLGELLSLRSYGRVLSKTDGPSFRVSWSDDGQIVRWDDQQLKMSEFRNIAKNVLERVTTMLDRLMYGWDPGCDLSNVKDRLTNNARGYSFVTEPANHLSESYFELSQRACLAEIDGLMSKDAWDKHAVRRYLALCDEFLPLLLLLIYLWGGQAARGTELLSVEYCNGSSTSRGVCVIMGMMALIFRHHKSRQATNNEFQVARFLPDKVGRPLYYYLVFIRPFSSMLRRDCNRSQVADGSLLFASAHRPSVPWQTTVLSETLQKTTKQLLGYGVHVQLYRQLSIAITEKHIEQIAKPFNRYDDKSSDAPMDAVFAWQSGHRPQQRAFTYGLDGAFPDSLQPALLRRYRWASEQWHLFLQLDEPSTSVPRSSSHNEVSSSQSVEVCPGTRPASASQRDVTKHSVQAKQPGNTTMGSMSPEDICGAEPQLSTAISNPRGSFTSSEDLTDRSRPYRPIFIFKDTPFGNRGQYPLKTSSHATPKERRKHKRQLTQVIVDMHGIKENGDRSSKRARLDENRALTQPLLTLNHRRDVRSLHGPWAAPEEITEIRQTSRSPWICRLPFMVSGTELERAPDLEPWRQVLAFLRETDSERNRFFGLLPRLRSIDQQFERWRLAGCQYCYAKSGRMHQDHALVGCHDHSQGKTNELARSMLRWLNQLKINRFSDGQHGYGVCGLCIETEAICKELIAADRVTCAGSAEEKRKHRVRLFDKELGPDGLCENKPTIKQTIAALWVLDDGIFAKAFTAMLAEDEGLDLTAENQITAWFERQVKWKYGSAPRLVFVFEALVAAFDFWRKQSRICQFIQLPTWIAESARSRKRIEGTLEWWSDKCGFCIGRRSSNAQACHPLRHCPHGGAEQRRVRLGESFFIDGFCAEGGCPTCGAPLAFCPRWEVHETGSLVANGLKTCRYKLLLYDAMVGLYQSGSSRYFQSICNSMVDEGLEDLDDEAVAAWLVRSAMLGEFECTNMAVQLVYWTEEIIRATY